MPKIPADDEHANNQAEASATGIASEGRKFFRPRVMVPVLLVAVVFFLLYGLDHLPSTLRSAKRAVSDRKLGTLFTRMPANELLSSENVLRAVGRGPVDPARVLSPGMEQLSESGSDTKPATPTQDMADSVEQESQARQSPPAGGGPETPDTGTPRAPSVTAGPPAVEMRGPGSAPSSPRDTQSERAEPRKDAESPQKQASAAPSGPTPTVGRFEDRDKTSRVEGKRSKKLAREASSPLSPPAAAVETNRIDQFQLPGSLTVKIHHYTGTVPKWGLMVIIDDSASMGRKLRTWSPNRLHSAVNLVEKLPEALDRGSKIGIRDFMCSKHEDKKSPAQSGCLSHMLYGWAAAPFKGMKEKLVDSNPGGKTNPCAAAAFSLKKDFASLGGLSPRLLLITDGAKRCAFKEVLGAIDKGIGKDKISVDVLALGMHRKRQAGYSKLAHRTNGAFYRIDSPSDVQPVMTKYTKLLKKPVKETVEVRGGNAVLSAKPDEEITLVPGAYSIVLPPVAGISPSKRTIDTVQIRSGETTVVQIRVNKKGKPIARIEPSAKTEKK